ncbi:MAG TPA: sigma-70 family RNA polymerase sigma factor, partial [Petrotogaceae bacterium]|nr:sigma-70 family RNA polymerase sigma factor [Petrotogaceae bacterium]
YDRYDPSMGANFYTYGMNRIRGAMLDYLRRIDWLPKELRHLIKGYENFMADNPDKHFTDEEIMDYLKISHDDFQKLKFSVRKSQILELDAYLTDKSYEEGMERAIADDADDPEVNAYKEILNEKLKEAVEELSEKDQLILSLYYEKGLTFREIGEVIGVSESRISQIHTAIIARLKRSLKGDE